MRETSRSPDKGSILARDAFLNRLREERDRSDREGTSFTVIAFSSPTPGMDFKPAAAKIAKRLRSTDVLGWLETGVLGVLLFHVDHDQAQRLAEQLAEGISRPEAPLHCKLYPHPPLSWRTEGGSDGPTEGYERTAGKP